MADDLREPFAAGVETLRLSVLRAGVLNAKALREDAETNLADIARFVDSTPAFEEASFQMVRNVIAFAQELYRNGVVADAEAARRNALASIDELAAALRVAHPSQRARSLGF